MKRTKLLQEVRKMRFVEAYGCWRKRSFTQEEAARLLRVSDRTFRRYINRYEENGLEGLYERRFTQESYRKARVDEVMSLQDLYREKYQGFNVKHFYNWYIRHHESKRSYTWVKNTLQNGKLVDIGRKKGPHRKKRKSSALEGMILFFNDEFKVAALEEGTAFVLWIGGCLDDILCEQHKRTVNRDNCVQFDGLSLQIPADQYRCHYVKV